MIALRLTIENETSLPDGGPLSYTLTGTRGIDIGRDKHLDWVLPDPSRYISSKHCEIRFRDGGYWLHDVSSNGTFINGSASRPVEPRRLRTGDRLEIGRYIIRVEVSGETLADRPQPDAVSAATGMSGDIWSVDGEVAAPAAAGEIRARRSSRPVVSGDMMDWAVDLPGPVGRPAPVAAVPVPRSGRTTPAAEVADKAFAGEPMRLPKDLAQANVAHADGVQADGARDDLDWSLPGTAQPGPPDMARDMPQARDVEPARPEPPRQAAPPARPDAFSSAFLSHFAKGAGLPPELLQGRDPAEFAEQLGRLMIAMTTELKALMQARAQTKGAIRSTNQTTVQALDNNPIPFAPTPEDALRLMLAGTGPGYLGAEAALKKSFDALKTHQLDTFIAMQAAVDAMVEQLDPVAVDRSAEPDKALGQLFASRKARLWDLHVARWQALAAAHDDGLRGAFMSFFAAAYDRRTGGRG
ncbi:type VI secretion system-associated FHA domain protein TagH [Phreatobacter stygius]|uniref:type VI secretion system-associated FHA domain protein TagH n=1 Tax=Phreatobacter stygius TaxID=1940610 RepID=UPI001476DA03|nr:type VI secretion system-associated FHA domain protein TagH [Phreatobacter stygius]